MAVPRLRVPSQHPMPGLSSDEVELYHRTYTTLLRSSGETLVRVLEPSHRSMNSSLHPLAASEELDLGAFLYATRRLPDEVVRREGHRHGPGGDRLQARRHRPDRGLGAARGAGAPAALVPRRPRDAPRAARLRLRPRRPDPDARRVPDRVEQDARQDAHRRAPRRRPGTGGVRRRARRLRGGLVAPAQCVGRPLRRAARGRRRPAAQPARADARRQRRRLRAHDAPLVAPGPADAAGARARGAPDLLRLLQRPLDRQPRHRHRPRAREGDRRVGRQLRRPRSRARARALPLGRGGGVVGELPLLRRARVLQHPPRGLRHLRAALRGRSAPSASPTSRAPPRCASPRR